MPVIVAADEFEDDEDEEIAAAEREMMQSCFARAADQRWSIAKVDRA